MELPSQVVVTAHGLDQARTRGPSANTLIHTRTVRSHAHRVQSGQLELGWQDSHSQKRHKIESALEVPLKRNIIARSQVCRHTWLVYEQFNARKLSQRFKDAKQYANRHSRIALLEACQRLSMNAASPFEIGQ